ncbi:MAG: CBS domain-containing protein [Planctomycetota bacterium]|jgi:CBS domain-containing protein
MATVQTEEATDNKPESAGADTAGKSQIIELSTESFKAFCEDISAMFSINMRSNKLGASIVNTEALQGHFKNLVAITSCEASGTLEGSFQIIFSREGLFTLAGAISMPAEMTSLLEKCIGPEQTMKNIKGGSIKEAEAVSDTVAEACNLLIGSWDRIFRKNFEGHKHLLQTNTFIGDPWDNPKEIIGIGSDDEIVFASYKIMISSFPAFLCGAIFPKTFLAKTDIEAIEAEQKAKAEAEKKAKAKAAEEAKAEAEEKAEGETEEKARAEAEEKAKTEAEEKAKAEAEEKAKAEAEEKAKAEAEEKEKAEAEEKEKAEAEEKAKAEAEEKEKAEAEEKAKAEAEEREKAEAEEKAKAEAEEKAKAEAEEKAKAEAEAEEKAKAEAEEKAKAEAEEKAKAEAEEKTKAEAEEKAKAEAEEKAKAEAEEKAKAEAEEKAKAEAEEKAKAEAEEKAKAEAEEKEKAEAEEKAKAEAEEKAETEEEPKAEAEVEEKAEAEEEPKVEVQTEEIAEAKEEPKAEAQTEEKAENKEEPKAEVQAEEIAETEEEPKAEAEVEEKAEAEEEPKAEVQAEEIVETEVEPKAEAEVEEKAEAEEEPKAETEAEEIAETEEPKAEAETEEKAEAKEEPKAEVQAEEIAEAEEPKAEAEVEEKVEAEEEPKAETEAEEKAETEEEPKAEAQTEEKAEAKEEPKAEAEVEEKAETKEEPKAETEAEEKAEAEEEPKAEAEVEEKAETEKQPKTKVEAGESQILELSTKSFKAFCDDISSMFGMGMKCEKQEEATTVKIETLQEHYKNLVSITSCTASGALEGTFQIIFSREGLFTLAGAISMPAQMTSMLEQCVGPEQTMKNIKSGSLKEAEGESDTVAEACNLLIGSWDRIFREGLEGHEHLIQTNNFIGDPWDNPKEKIGMASDEELVFASYKITISSFPAFDCGVIFPKTIFAKVNAEAEAEAEEKVKAEAEEKVKAEAEEKVKAEAEEKAKAEAEEKTKTEAEEKAKAEAEEKTKAEPEAETKAEATEEKDKPEAEAKQEETDEKTSAPEQSQEPPKGKVSETIQKMAQSPAILPGESGKATIRHINVSSEICVTDIMQKDVVWATSEESVQQAMTKMQQQDSGYIMIGKDGILEGIVSKSDITGATSIYLRPIFSKWYGPLDDATLQIKLKWIMSRPVRTVSPKTPLVTIIENICRFGGRGLPVVDEEGKVQGLVTVFDIFRTLLNTSENVSTVGKTAEAPALT